MCFLQKDKNIRPRFLILFPKYLIFDGKAIQSGGQVVAHGFFWPSLRTKFFSIFVDFEMEKFLIFKSSLPVNKA